MADGNSLRIQVKSRSGEIETVSPEQFRKRFRVEYTSKLIVDPEVRLDPFEEPAKEPEPVEWQRRALQFYFGQTLVHNGPTAEMHSTLKRWLYAEKIRQGYTANLYFGRVPQISEWGIFAGGDIEPGELIGEYTGVAHYRRPEEDRDNVYLFDYSGRVVLDARDKGNYTRYFNHGKKNANAACAYVRLDGVLHVFFVAISHISKDKQILYDYGPKYWHPLAPPSELE